MWNAITLLWSAFPLRSFCPIAFASAVRLMGCVVPWGSTPSSGHPITQSVFQKTQWELEEETWSQTSTFLWFFSWPSCSASLKSLGVMAYQAGLCKYIHLYFSILILCEPFLRAFEEENGTGQLNLNGSGMCRRKAERMVITSDKKMAQFCRQMGSKESYFTLAAAGAQLWTATVRVPWQWPKLFGYKFSLLARVGGNVL